MKEEEQKGKINLKTRTLDYSLLIIRLLEALPNKRVYWIISDQLLRSATSVGANIIEAKAASSRKEFIRFYEIALRSAHESLYWLELLEKNMVQSKKDIQKSIQETTELVKILSKCIINLKNKKPLISRF